MDYQLNSGAIASPNSGCITNTNSGVGSSNWDTRKIFRQMPKSGSEGERGNQPGDPPLNVLVIRYLHFTVLNFLFALPARRGKAHSECLGQSFL